MNMKKTEEYAALVAMDWGEEQHAFAWQFGAGGQVETGKLDASAETLHRWLEELGQRCGGRPVALAIEGGRNAVLYALWEHPWIEIYQVHPATSARFRQAFIPSGAKDDVPDCRVLLSLLTRHRDRLSPLLRDTAATRELAALVLARRQGVDQRKDLGNQLRSVLKGYFPQALELVGEDWCSPLALDLLERWPELGALKKARAQTLRSFYSRHNVRQAPVIEARLQAVAAARPLTKDRAVIAPAMMKMLMVVDMIRTLQKHVAQIEARIAEAFAAHPSNAFFRELPGAGAAFAPRLLAAFGDHPSRYPDAASLQKFSGVAPVRQKSGQQLWTHWRWRAPVFLRQTFVEWAGETVVFSSWAKAYYRRQRRLGKRHHAVLRALAFKWIRILWRCRQTGQPYDEARYLAALELRRSPLIQELKLLQASS
jgi:transposase